jgi:hypothetical protein
MPASNNQFFKLLGDAFSIASAGTKTISTLLMTFSFVASYLKLKFIF